MKKVFQRAAGALALLAAGAFLAVGWVGSERAIHPRVAHYRWSQAEFPDLHPRAVRFPASDGVTLAGRLFAGSGQGLVVLSNGYGDNQDQMLPYVEFLHRAGFDVFTYDMRARGASAGEAVTLGALEAPDLSFALDYLSTQPGFEHARIGAMGLSLGGAVSLLAAARDPRIRAVIDDSGFADAPSVIAASFEHFIGLPAFPFAPVTVWIAGLRAGVDVNQVRPVDSVALISPRPILFIHCMGDRIVPPENTRRNLAAARVPKQVWWVPGGGHIQGRTLFPDEYASRVTRFFQAALAPVP